MSKTPQAIASNNTYGLDVPYFSKKLKLVLQGLNNYMPEELARELARLAKTSAEVAASGELSHALKSKNESAESRIAQLEADLAAARKDQARYQYVIDWLESNVIATAAFTHARTKSEYDQAIDAAIKE